MKKNFISLICAFCGVITTSSFADSTISIINAAGSSTIQVKDERILVRSSDPENTAVLQNRTINEAIFDTKTETLYLIDHANKSISPVTRSTVEQLSSTIDAAVGALDSLSDENRESLSGFMQGLGINLPEEKKQPEIELIARSSQEFRGIQCNESSVVQDGVALGQVCITQGNSTPMPQADYETLFKTQSFLLEMAQHMAPLSEQFGQSIPSLDGLEISGLLVNSNPNKSNPDVQNTHFSVSAIDTNKVNDILVPSDYQTEELLP